MNRHTIEMREAILAPTIRFIRMTVRQVFYQLVTAGVVAKTSAGYQQVQRQVLALRRLGELEWGFIVDGTRWPRKPSTWRSVDDYLDVVKRSYRRDLWQRQDVRLEFWLEKDALAEVVGDITDEWDVSLMVSRGQSSDTFVYSVAEAATEAWEYDGARTFIYTLYDFDKSGREAHAAIERKIADFTDAPVTVEKLALTVEQVEGWKLPTRPPKKHDPEPWAVELDALAPAMLTALVEGTIEAHLDEREWRVEQAMENEERAGLLALAEDWRDAA